MANLKCNLICLCNKCTKNILVHTWVRFVEKMGTNKKVDTVAFGEEFNVVVFFFVNAEMAELQQKKMLHLAAALEQIVYHLLLSLFGPVWTNGFMLWQTL